MQTAIATVCVSGTLREKLEAIAAAGFRHVEIFEADLIACPISPAEIRRLCADLGLAIVTCQPFRDFEGMPAALRARTFDRAERKFDLLQTLGADLMFVCSNASAESLGHFDRLATDFAELGERAARRGLKIGYEALSWGKHVSDYRDAWEIVRRADQPNLGVILDSFHILALDLELASLAKIPRERISFVQIADAPRLKMDLLSWARHWRCLPGQGEFDLGAFMEALAATGYDGCLSLEIFNDRFRAASAREVARDGHRSLIWLLDAATRRIDRTISGTPAMPPPAPARGVEFIEFAVGEAGQVQLEELLTALGLAKVGQHRSKDVSLWQQGEIRIVVNRDAQGFAHAYQIAHGTSVCAFALKVPDAQTTVARAKAMLDTPHIGAHGPDELDIPAVRGLGGSLIYFVDDTPALGRWAEVDFVPTGTRPDVSELINVDHISQTMHYEEMLTWVLFYTSLLEAGKTPSQAVIDPGGVVQSQAVESGISADGTGGLRLVLNGSQSHRTLSARFVTDFFGSGVQHIALRTGDLRASVRRLMARGLTMLPIPQNYYDDLTARTDLGEEIVSEMKSLNILYDRDANGVFLHAYTRSLDGGFFFELIERSGYAGYGAANAGIRLAAQTHLARPETIPKH